MTSGNKALKYSRAHPSDLAEVQELLESHALPAGDCKRHLGNFVIAKHNSALIGAGGFERCGKLGLLRSFVIKHHYRNQGIAETIFSLVKADATNSGISQFYLLTTTASKYFERLGFSACPREDVPNPVKATRQFSELCPATAIVMSLDLQT